MPQQDFAEPGSGPVFVAWPCLGQAAERPAPDRPRGLRRQPLRPAGVGGTRSGACLSSGAGRFLRRRHCVVERRGRKVVLPAPRQRGGRPSAAISRPVAALPRRQMVSPMGGAVPGRRPRRWALSVQSQSAREADAGCAPTAALQRSAFGIRGLPIWFRRRGLAGATSGERRSRGAVARSLVFQRARGLCRSVVRRRACPAPCRAA